MVKKVNTKAITAEKVEANKGENVIDPMAIQSFFSDGILTVVPGIHNVKIMFFEEIPTENARLDRIANVMITMPRGRFHAVVEVLSKISEESKSDDEGE